MHEDATYKTALAIAARRLKSAGMAHGARDARHLMQHVSGLTAAELIRDEGDEIPARTRAAFFDLVERLAVGEPFEHLTGEAHFYGLDFRITKDTLIPRADSEVVVDEALARLPLGHPPSIADLGTGSGCLLAALLANHPGARGLGIERSKRAAEVAYSNMERLGRSDRAVIRCRSWEDWMGWDEVDLVISNPPYIASDVIPTLDASVRSFEPHSALDGGRDGLDAYRSIIDLAAAHMKPGAWLVFEIGFDQRAAVTALLDKAGFSAISCGQDHGQRDRVVSARR